MNSFRLPFFTELRPARRVLVAGAGGGFDVFSGLPLYFNLRAAGKDDLFPILRQFLRNVRYNEVCFPVYLLNHAC